MDKTPECRAKCASSADMLTCTQDCLSRRPLAAKAPQLLAIAMTPTAKKVGIAVGVVAAVAAVVGIAVMIRHKRSPLRL